MASNKYSDALIASTEMFKTRKGVYRPQLTYALDCLPLTKITRQELFKHMMDWCRHTTLTDQTFIESKFDCIYILSILSDKEMEELILNWNL